MTTVATFNKPEDAHLLRMRLEDAGIPAFLLNEHITQLEWLPAITGTGVRVQVADQDVAAVREFFAKQDEE